MTPGTKVLVEGVVVEPHPFCEGTGLIAVNISDLLFAPAQLRPLADVERLEMRVKELEGALHCIQHHGTKLPDSYPCSADYENGYGNGVASQAEIAAAAIAKETP